jgi:chromosome segregation ATPase
MESEETLKQNNEILKAIADLSAQINKRLDDHDSQFAAINKKLAGYDNQFEAVRQGLVQNSSAFDRLESVVYNVRSDVSALKADIKDLSEEIRQTRKVLV